MAKLWMALAQLCQKVEIRKVLEKHIELPEEDPYEKAHRIWDEGDIDGALAILSEMNQKDSVEPESADRPCPTES